MNERLLADAQARHLLPSMRPTGFQSSTTATQKGQDHARAEPSLRQGAALSVLRRPLRGSDRVLQEDARCAGRDDDALQARAPSRTPACARPATRTRSCTPASASATPRSWRPTAARKASRCFKGFALSVSAKDEADADRMFNALADGGQVQMPLGKTFFSPRFGMVADRFGMGWMVIALPPEVAAEPGRIRHQRACSTRRASWCGSASPSPSA